MSEFDDSALLMHARVYDPQKAREYYLRTRKLKGRRPTTATVQAPGKGGRPTTAVASEPRRDKTASRQAELRAQKAALEKRLDRLREVLEQAVAAAKGRSGIKTPDKAESTTSPAEGKKGKSKAADGKDKPLTQKQKRDKAEQAREAYEKAGGTPLSQDVAELQRQVKDIQAKIKTALEQARSNSKKPRVSAIASAPATKTSIASTRR